MATPKREPKPTPKFNCQVGDVWKSDLTDLTFTVTEVAKDEITVDVQRLLPAKGRQPTLDVRSRNVTTYDWEFFVQAYSKTRKPKVPSTTQPNRSEVPEATEDAP